MAETPGPRRQTRSNSRAFSAAPTPVPQSRRAPRGGANRKNATPLPATNNAENNAYGSMGKVDLGSQQATNMSNDEFLRAFALARDDAVVQTRTTRTTRTTQTRANQSRNNDDTESNVDDDHDTDNDDDHSDDQRYHDHGQLDARGTDEDTILRGTQSASKSGSSVRFSTESQPPQRAPANARNRSPTRGLPASHEGDEDDDHPSALPSHLTRLRNNYDTSSPIAASSILQQRNSRAWSVTDINSGFSYEAPPQANASSSRQPPRASSRVSSRAPLARAAAGRRASGRALQPDNPPKYRVLLENIPRWWNQTPTWAKLSPLIAALAVLLVLMMGSATGTDLVARTGSLVAKPFYASSSWLQGLLSTNSTLSRGMSKKVTDIQTSLAELRSENTALREALKSIENLVPSAVMIRKDPSNGQTIIPDEFLKALLSKLRKDNTFQPDHSWDAFLEKNKARIARHIEATAAPVVRDAVSTHISSGEILSKAQFMLLLEQKWSQLETKNDQQFGSLQGNIQRQMHRYKSDSANPSSRTPKNAEHWIIATMISNYELTLKTVNYFSPAMGATIVGTLSSPTYNIPEPWWYKFLPSRLFSYRPNDRITALTHWNEALDCWCATPSTTRGQAQLAVHMTVPISPESITIEHIPAQGTLDIAAAPRTFEVWVHAPHVQPPLPENQAPDCTSTDGPPVEGYICIGGGMYDIHGPDGRDDDKVNHIQNFQLYAQGDIGLVQDVIFRATGNWGADWTCLYRLRMHGSNARDIEAMADMQRKEAAR